MGGKILLWLGLQPFPFFIVGLLGNFIFNFRSLRFKSVVVQASASLLNTSARTLQHYPGCPATENKQKANLSLRVKTKLPAAALDTSTAGAPAFGPQDQCHPSQILGFFLLVSLHPAYQHQVLQSAVPRILSLHHSKSWKHRSCEALRCSSSWQAFAFLQILLSGSPISSRSFTDCV